MSMEEREIEEISGFVFDSMLRSEDVRNRVISVVCDSNEINEFIAKKVKETLKNHWLTIAYHLIILSAAAFGIVQFFFQNSIHTS